MLLHTYTIYNDVIKLNTTELFKPSQRFTHKALKGAKGVVEPEGHDLEFKQAKFIIKS